MQLSSLIGKQILSPAGEAFGYVTAAHPAKDLTRLACLIAADGDEEEIVIPARAILSLGDAVIAGKMRLEAPAGVEAPIGKEVYSYAGEYLGTVCDLLFGEGSEAILVITKGGIRTTAAAACAIFGEHIVLYLDKEARDAAARSSAKKKPAAPRTPRQSATRPSAPAAEAPKAHAKSVSLPAEKPSAPPSEPPVPAEETKNEATMSEIAPSQTNAVRLKSNTDLLGRIVKRSVFDSFGMPVALAGERITPAVLARARRANLLLALAVNTLSIF